MKFDQAQRFQVQHERNGADAVVLKLFGEFDMACCDDFEAAVQSLNGDPLRQVVIDLGGLTFIDSSGIRTLLDSKRRAEEHGVVLVVRVPQEGQVRQVFELTGVDRVLDGVDAGQPPD